MFSRLSLSRDSGFGLTRIKISEIMSLIGKIDLIGTNEEFLDIMQSIDSSYIQYMDNLKEQKEKKDG